MLSTNASRASSFLPSPSSLRLNTKTPRILAALGPLRHHIRNATASSNPRRPRRPKTTRQEILWISTCLPLLSHSFLPPPLASVRLSLARFSPFPSHPSSSSTTRLGSDGFPPLSLRTSASTSVFLSPTSSKTSQVAPLAIPFYKMRRRPHSPSNLLIMHRKAAV